MRNLFLSFAVLFFLVLPVGAAKYNIQAYQVGGGPYETDTSYSDLFIEVYADKTGFQSDTDETDVEVSSRNCYLGTGEPSWDKDFNTFVEAEADTAKAWVTALDAESRTLYEENTNDHIGYTGVGADWYAKTTVGQSNGSDSQNAIVKVQGSGHHKGAWLITAGQGADDVEWHSELHIELSTVGEVSPPIQSVVWAESGKSYLYAIYDYNDNEWNIYGRLYQETYENPNADPIFFSDTKTGSFSYTKSATELLDDIVPLNVKNQWGKTSGFFKTDSHSTNGFPSHSTLGDIEVESMTTVTAHD